MKVCFVKVKVKFVDYGDIEECNVEDVRIIPNSNLLKLPYQV
jgi:Tudor domain